MSRYSGSLLVKSKLSDFEPIGYEGEPVWKSAAQIIHILIGRLSDDHGTLFATPVVDETDNRIDWFAASKGAFRRWNTLDIDAQIEIAQTVERYVADIEALSAKLIESDVGDAVKLGDRLRGAFYVASEADVFVVDGKPVLANWSLRPRNHPSTPSVLPKLSLLVAEPVVVGETIEPVHDVAQGSRLPRLLWLLLPFLLIAALLIYWFGWGNTSTRETTRLNAASETGERPGKALSLPAEAMKSGDLSFLEGRWRSFSGDLINEQTQEPIVAEYTFNKNGRGTKQILEKHQACETRVVAEAIGGRLNIKEKSEAKCPDGRWYVLSETICEPGKGQTALCVVLQNGIKEETVVIITRIRG